MANVALMCELTYAERRILTMQRTNSLRVRKERIFPLDANSLAVLLEDVLQTGDGRVVLDEANAGSERNNDRHVEEQSAFSALFAS